MFLILYSLWLIASPSFGSSCEVQCAKYDLINVQFYANEMDDSFNTRNTAISSFNVNNKLPKLRFPVTSAEEITAKLNQLARECKRAKTLRIDGHAKPGLIYLDSKNHQGITRHDILNDHVFPECALAKDVVVDSLGCNLAKGCEGQAFLLAFAERVLSIKGGTIKGNTDFGYTLLGLPVFSIDLNRQSLTVDRLTQKIIWDDPSTNFNSCRDQLNASYSYAKGIFQELMQECTMSDADRKSITLDFQEAQARYLGFMKNNPHNKNYALNAGNQAEFDLFDQTKAATSAISNITDEKYQKKNYPSIQCKGDLIRPHVEAYDANQSFLRLKN